MQPIGGALSARHDSHQGDLVKTRSCFLLLSLSAASLLAQNDRGTVTGSVTDQGSAAIAGAAITATHIDTNTKYKAETSPDGEFHLPQMPVGVYRVTVEHPGFK